MNVSRVAFITSVMKTYLHHWTKDAEILLAKTYIIASYGNGSRYLKKEIIKFLQEYADEDFGPWKIMDNGGITCSPLTSDGREFIIVVYHRLISPERFKSDFIGREEYVVMADYTDIEDNYCYENDTEDEEDEDTEEEEEDDDDEEILLVKANYSEAQKNRNLIILP